MFGIIKVYSWYIKMHTRLPAPRIYKKWNSFVLWSSTSLAKYSEVGDLRNSVRNATLVTPFFFLFFKIGFTLKKIFCVCKSISILFHYYSFCFCLYVLEGVGIFPQTALAKNCITDWQLFSNCTVCNWLLLVDSPSQTWTLSQGNMNASVHQSLINCSWHASLCMFQVESEISTEWTRKP